MSYVASVGEFTNGGVESFRKDNEEMPKAYTILRHVKRNEIDELFERTDNILRMQFKEINKKLRIRSAMIAIDETLIPFYDRDNDRKGIPVHWKTYLRVKPVPYYPYFS